MNKPEEYGQPGSDEGGGCPSRKTIKNPNHPKAHKGFVRKYIIIAEKALGKHLPSKACVHHVDGNINNNINTNLVICEDHTYHKLLHKRHEAYKSTGNANLLKCWICKRYDQPENLFTPKPNRNRNRDYASYHLSCKREYKKELKYRRQIAKLKEEI